MDLIPSRLQPIVNNLRAGAVVTYQNLCNQPLTVDEKNWLCREVNGTSSDVEGQIRTKRGLVRRYGLYKNFFQKNLKHFNQFGFVEIAVVDLN